MKYKIYYLIFLIAIFFSFFMNYLKINAKESIDEKLIITKVNLEDNFSDNVVVVVLKHNISLEFIDYDSTYFSEIDCDRVEDLTEYTAIIVKKQIKASKTGDYSKIKERMDKKMLVNVDDVHRILCLYLKKPGKDNVVSAIKELEKRDDIISAEPDYIDNISSSSNDYYYLSGDQWGCDDISSTSLKKDLFLIQN